MPAESWANVVKRNKDDSHGEIPYQKKDQIDEEVRKIRSKESPCAAQRAVGNHQQNDRPILNQRINGVPKV